jgi:tyrocidine synthetase-3
MSEDMQSNRFYPESVPPFPHEPTREHFKIVKTDDKGEGIIALSNFHPGEIAFCFRGEVRTGMTLFTLQIEPGLHLHDPFFMGKVLHSCDPNLSCDMKSLTFTVLREIHPGDYLSMDYEQTEDELWRFFDCQCGSPQCKGMIMGKKYRAQMHPQKELVMSR